MSGWTYIGIVGAEGAKFTARGERQARELIRRILAPEDVVLVSGGCHLGGIDIWAEEEYAALRAVSARPDPIIHLPKEREWKTGYMPRNIAIAEDSVEVHNITVKRVADAFKGHLFSYCYHCAQRARSRGEPTFIPHIKSGGCWTAYRAEKLGKIAQWYFVSNEEGV